MSIINVPGFTHPVDVIDPATIRTATVPGFANPVDDAQAIFRAALEAFSRPGAFVPLPVLPHPLADGGLSQGMLALALALCDHDTPIWLDAAANTQQTRHHLRFHCTAPLVENPAEAVFAFITQPETMPRLTVFNPGRADFPDRSATLVIRVDRTAEASLEITGPGVKGNECGRWEAFRLGGLPSWFWADWADNHAAYPLGVDILFVTDKIDASGKTCAAVLGLPRTARVRVKERVVCM